MRLRHLAPCALGLLLLGCTESLTGPDGGGPLVAGGATVAVGSLTTCALGTGGRVSCWGHEGSGALGNPAVARGDGVPTPVAGDRAYAAVFGNLTGRAADPVVMCALTAEGAAECWGGDVGNLLGPPDATPCAVFVTGFTVPCVRSPRPVAPSMRFRRLAVGTDFICGIATSGTSYCWGAGRGGQLGTGSTADASVPTPIAGNLRLADIAAGYGVACGLTADGTGYCWGAGSDGQLGNGHSESSAVPVRVDAPEPLAHISAGARYACAVGRSGRGYCWGWGAYWTLASSANPSWFRRIGAVVPEELTLTDARRVSIGVGHFCAVRAGGQATCWGWNPFEQSGASGSATCQGSADQAICTPTPVGGDVTFAEAHAGTYHSCGRGTDGAVYCWGDNGSKQLGPGAARTSALPQRVALP